jgi:hypothetical protein
MAALTRRDWLSMTTLPAAAWLAAPALATRQDGPAKAGPHVPNERIRAIIDAFEKQGFHRTATDVDRASGDWLAREIERIGLTPALEPFSIDRVDLVDTALVVAGRRIEGVPLFDGAFTGADGVSGRLGPIDGDAEIGLAATAPNAAAAGALGDARRANRHRAIVCVTRGGRPGLCPSNADEFLKPFGPPVIQVSSEETAFLDDCARQRREVQVRAAVKRTAAQAVNVTAIIAGRNPSATPVIVMTPRSGWWTCASERGGGIACWLELMRELRDTRPARDVVFVASSGHELGHLGINAFIDRRRDIVSRSAGWMHFGANIGAAQDPGNTLQASDDQFESLLADAMQAGGLRVDRRVPRGTVPNGEAEAVHRGGGRYVSIIGRNALFHNQADRGPDAVDPGVIARFIDIFTTVAKRLAS